VYSTKLVSFWSHDYWNYIYRDTEPGRTENKQSIVDTFKIKYLKTSGNYMYR
jgi:hypothetical protein